MIKGLLPLTNFILAVLAALISSSHSTIRAQSPLIVVRSPNGLARIEFTVKSNDKGDAVPHYRVYYKDRLVVSDSRLGVELVAESPLGRCCTIQSVESRSQHTSYTMVSGKRTQVVDHFVETMIALREREVPKRKWEVVFRAYNDGVAFRYKFPVDRQSTAKTTPQIGIAAEHSEFSLPDDASAYALPLNSFTTSYERLYVKKKVTEIPTDWLLGLPLLIELPSTGWAALTEANLTDYAGMYLARSAGREAILTSRLSPLPGQPRVAVQLSLPHDSPWRVIMLADDPGRFVESDLVQNLNEPCALADTSWIRTGKTTFPWWNGYYEEKVPFQPGLNTATMKYYIDFCAASGIPFHSLDGHEDTAWYGGPIVPYKGADITRALPTIDLPEVIRYAREKKVGIRLWMHWQAAKAHMDRAFPLYRQ
jgi:alpha-glucosidase